MELILDIASKIFRYTPLDLDRFKSQESCRQKEVQPYVLKQLKIGLCLSIGNLASGYSTGWATPVIQILKEPTDTPFRYIILDSDASSIENTLIIGAIIGSILSGIASNKIGRKPCLLLTPCFNLAGYAIMANARNVTTIMVARTVAGVAAGFVSVLNVVYLGEIASPKIRGSLTAMTAIMHTFGSLLVYSLGPYVTIAAGSYVCIGITCLHMLLMSYVPESPIYQVMKGNLKAARLTLHDLGRTEDVDEELRHISKHANEALLPQSKDDRENVPKRWRMRERKNIKAFFITAFLLCLQACIGRIVVIYFGIIIRSPLSSITSNVGTVVMGLTELSGVIITPLLVERYGRRFMLLMSLGCCSLFMGILCAYFYLEVKYYITISSIRWLPLVLMMLILFTFKFGLGIVPNILAGEMYSPPFRGPGCSLSMTLAWTVLLACSSTFDNVPPVLRNYGVFWLSAGISAVGFVFVMFVVPETRGKSLLEIGYLLERYFTV